MNRPPRSTEDRALPEEVVDHVDDLAGPLVDQDRIVPVADPAVARRSVGQAVLPRIVDPVAAAIIARPQPPTDRIRLIAPAERIVINPDVEPGPVPLAPVAPVVAAVAPPVGGPPHLVAPAILEPKRRLRALAWHVADHRHA